MGFSFLLCRGICWESLVELQHVKHLVMGSTIEDGAYIHRNAFSFPKARCIEYWSDNMQKSRRYELSPVHLKFVFIFDLINYTGAPGWHSWLSVLLWISARVVISGLWDWAPVGLHAQCGVCLRFSLLLPFSVHSLSLSQINNLKKIKKNCT